MLHNHISQRLHAAASESPGFSFEYFTPDSSEGIDDLCV